MKNPQFSLQTQDNLYRAFAALWEALALMDGDEQRIVTKVDFGTFVYNGVIWYADQPCNSKLEWLRHNNKLEWLRRSQITR